DQDRRRQLVRPVPPVLRRRLRRAGADPGSVDGCQRRNLLPAGAGVRPVVVVVHGRHVPVVTAAPTTLEVREQPRLPIRRQVEICADGIRHRLARSLITLAVVALGVAFLANVLTESVIVAALRRRAEAVERADGALPRFAGTLTRTPTPESFVRRLADTPPGP